MPSFLSRNLKPNLIQNISILKKNNSKIISSDNENFDKTPEGYNNFNDASVHKNSKKVWIESYGCSANVGDAEIIAGILKKNGYEITHDPKNAELNFIVTCSVKDVTEHRMLYRIEELSKTKKPLIVGGCLPKTISSKIEKINPTISMLGPNSIDKTLETVTSALNGTKTIHLTDSIENKINLPKERSNPIVGIIEIGSGCLSECSFCQTKIAKGWLTSYRIGDIVRQITTDVLQGCREIWLTSTDSGCYGRDINTNLVELLKSCTNIDGEFKIRLGMVHPLFLSDMVDDLIKIYMKSDKIFKFLHIPVQSGSNNVLKSMKRNHSIELFTNIVNKFREQIPDLTIATDVIVGFPTETEKDFEQTIDVIKNISPDAVHISKYSSREGTVSSKYKKLPSQLIKRRSEKMTKICNHVIEKRDAFWYNWRGPMLINQTKSNYVLGRNYAYKSIFIKKSEFSNLNLSYKLGDTVNIRVVGKFRHSLEGKLV